jgi:Zn-dependent protease
MIETSRSFRFEIHWTTPLFPLLVFCWTPLSYLLGLGVLLAHEAGHALAARARGRTPYAIRMHGFGGHCLIEGGGAPIDEAWIAWGGIGAQLPLLAVGAWLGQVLPPSIDNQVWMALFFANLLLIIGNIAPIQGLDGAKAWGLFPLLFRERQRRRSADARWAEKDRTMWKAIESAKKPRRDD